jgi:hypothetical protein
MWPDMDAVAEAYSSSQRNVAASSSMVTGGPCCTAAAREAKCCGMTVCKAMAAVRDRRIGSRQCSTQRTCEVQRNATQPKHRTRRMVSRRCGVVSRRCRRCRGDVAEMSRYVASRCSWTMLGYSCSWTMLGYSPPLFHDANPRAARAHYMTLSFTTKAFPPRGRTDRRGQDIQCYRPSADHDS